MQRRKFGREFKIEAVRLVRGARVRLNRHITFLERELTELDSEIGQAIEASPVWCETEALLKSVPSIGDVTARTLLAQLPELGTIGRYQLAAHVGIAPINCDSGQMRGRQSIVGGRTSVRGVLYMAALTAIQRGSPFRSFYEKLNKRGQARKVVLVVVMRKLLVTLTRSYAIAATHHLTFNTAAPSWWRFHGELDL